MGKGDVSGKEMTNMTTGFEHVTTIPQFKRRKVLAVRDFPPGYRRGATTDHGLNRQIAVDQGKYNEAAIKVGAKMLMQKRRHLCWSACSAHYWDLILKEISNRKSARRVLDEAKKITSFIYNHTWTIDYIQRYTEGRELL
ncbi:hypothetical protein J1N35_022150 [Gossypium stocksii]|uniref:DUF659 domain-containing protein n=1 Tax=Gossypium stocksii TaxID=47602 RepID=A0A9D4A364_9ROSI|nr:hypothetical protein J1N35_022150 [Gossypium stocksii]